MKNPSNALLGREPAVATCFRPGAALFGLGVLLATAPAGAQLLPGEQSLQMQYLESALIAGSGVADIAAGDIDQDGDVDVLTADWTAGVIRVLINDGALGYTSQTLDAGVPPIELALSDADADGDLDLFVGFTNGMRWMRNDGAGDYTVAATLPFPAGDGAPVSEDLVDVNGDGRLDVVLGLASHQTATGPSGGVWVAIDDGAGGFQPLPTSDLVFSPAYVAIADFNGDGHLDIAALGAHSFTTPSVGLALGLGDGSFKIVAPTFPVGVYGKGLAAGDFDGDGDADLATGFKYAVSIRVNDGTGSFTLAQSLGVGAYVKAIAAGDLDRDGDIDLVATSGSAIAIRLATNDATGHFTVTNSVAASIQCTSLILADTNGDGYPDPWAADGVTAGLFSGASHSIVARYGQAKMNSLGVLPAMTATGTPGISGSGFTASVTRMLPLQPALIVLGFAPGAQPALGGQLLVQTPAILIATTTSAGSGAPGLSDASVDLPITGSQLGAAGLGSKLFVQMLSLDPLQLDGTSASLSDGLWFEIIQ